MNILKIKLIITVLAIIGLSNIVNAQPLTPAEIDKVRELSEQITIPNQYGFRMNSKTYGSSQIALYNDRGHKFGSFVGQYVGVDKTFQIRLGNETIMTMKNGNMGIGEGITNPMYKLHVSDGDIKVDGCLLIGDVTKTGDNNVNLASNYSIIAKNGILSEKVKVALKNQGDWSDYVFEEDYEMMDINDLEGFVTENKHLPNVPSAEEMVANGLDVAKMDAKLLEKIEEAYLYIIDMNKEMKTMNEKVDALANENGELKASLSAISTSGK